MAHVRKEEAKSKGDRLQTILRLVQEHPISRQEVLLDYLRKEGFDVNSGHDLAGYPGAVPGQGRHRRGLPLCFQPEREL